MASDEARVTESKETGKRKAIISVPVTLSLCVPLELELDIPQEIRKHDEKLGVDVVDILECEDVAESVLAAAGESEVTMKALDQLVTVALRFKEKNPDVDAYFTPFAGLVPETQL